MSYLQIFLVPYFGAKLLKSIWLGELYTLNVGKYPAFGGLLIVGLLKSDTVKESLPRNSLQLTW